MEQGVNVCERSLLRSVRLYRCEGCEVLPWRSAAREGYKFVVFTRVLSGAGCGLEGGGANPPLKHLLLLHLPMVP